MSAARMQKRHPKAPVEELLTTRAEIIAFAQHISKDETFCREVSKTIETFRHNDAIVAEHKRRQALPKWRRWLNRIAREW